MLEIEERARRIRESLNDSKVQEAMRARCEEDGHHWENCCSVFFQVYMRCKWCGERR
jgi:hypothetical protein